ncbi:hypothetical protein [Kineosporia babensis]|uniref:DUF4760 domain-containing protein n=1 Tax=Kineosporia babensis TaxID=499548 RepID=A0A9X1NJS2_9ACTN|nr:hypothetical protein [Kineosporia babensis]MCD5314854.1 hypothetical protein [Kineosporia babensis]
MDAEIIAVGISLLALAITVWLAFKQLSSERAAHHLGIVSDLLDDFRSSQFHDDHRFLAEELPRTYSPELGVAGLPEEVRERFYRVLYFYQKVALLTALGILSDRRFVQLLHQRMAWVWSGVKPHVEIERTRDLNGERLLRGVQDLVESSEGLPVDPLERDLFRRLRR